MKTSVHTKLQEQLLALAAKVKPKEVNALVDGGSDLPPSASGASPSAVDNDGFIESDGLVEHTASADRITGSGGSIKSGNVLSPHEQKLKENAELVQKWESAAVQANKANSMGLFSAPATQAVIAPVVDAHRAIMSNPLTAGLGYGALAAGGYGLANLWRNREYTPTPEERRKRRRNALLLGLAGAGLGVGLRKKSSFHDPLTFIVSKLNADTSLSYSQRQQLVAQVAALPTQQQTSLVNIIASLVGAGIGAVVSKYILGLGGLGTSIGAGIGALAGFRSRLPAPAVNNSVDFFGRTF